PAVSPTVHRRSNSPRGSGGMADAHGSGPCAREGVRVQLPPSPPPRRASSAGAGEARRRLRDVRGASPYGEVSVTHMGCVWHHIQATLSVGWSTATQRPVFTGPASPTPSLTGLASATPSAGPLAIPGRLGRSLPSWLR